MHAFSIRSQIGVQQTRIFHLLYGFCFVNAVFCVISIGGKLCAIGQYVNYIQNIDHITPNFIQMFEVKDKIHRIK